MAVVMDEAFKRKRFLSFIIVAGYLFLGGCEYAVIFPTAWEYLTTLGVTDEYWLGFTVSGYSFSAAVAGVIGGRLADMYINHTKTIVMVSILIMAIGNVQYTIGISVWNILCSRLLCGVGTAAGSAMLAEICRTTAIEERTPILAICNATRQLGILVGPAFQLALSFFNFRILGVTITPLNAPGVFMGILWLLFFFATMFMFYNLTAELKALQKQQNETHVSPHRARRITITEPTKSESSFESSQSSLSGQNYGTITEADHESEMEVSISGPSSRAEAMTAAVGGRTRKRELSVGERFFQSVAKSGHRQTDGQVDLLQASIVVETTYKKYVDEFLTDTFIMLLSMVFILFFCQVGVETVIPVIMEDYFHYGVYENSLVYMAGGAEALIVFFAVALISRHVRDTTLQIVGWVLILIAQLWLMFVIPTFKEGDTQHLVYFMVGIVILYLGYPIASVANTGLYSKVLSNETQGLGQGLRRLASYLGLIYGPSWAGSTVKMPYLYLGVPITIMLINGVMLAVSYKNLRKIEDALAESSRVRNAESRQNNDNEATPLINNDC